MGTGWWRLPGTAAKGRLGNARHIPRRPHCQGTVIADSEAYWVLFCAPHQTGAPRIPHAALPDRVITLPWAVASDCHQIVAGQALRCGFAAQAPGRGEAGRAALALGLF